MSASTNSGNGVPPTTRAARVLVAALALLAVLFVVWFAPTPSPWVALVVFALPPALLALGRWRGRRTAGYWASVFALFWFSHGVMVAYSRPGERGYALAEVALALVIIFAASGPGMRARLAQKKAARTK
ncbi:DUF2069 domain-containing protein [Lysobacter koreensis]|uniref:DUF2069 domain-containing protein n=1 Tax=Lysobacter koreensis TaxID=266122 RepID=A0ABW2YTV2_9GAMM